MRLWNPKKYTWLIDNDVDTTTTPNSTCAYDRFVYAGGCSDCIKRITGVQPFDFGSEFQLTRNQIKSVSDHWPIELSLDVNYPNPNPEITPQRIRARSNAKKYETSMFLSSLFTLNALIFNNL